MTEIEGFSPDFRTELAAQLAELAPEAITDGKVDVEKLKELLQGDAEDTTERFGLFWPGKKGAIRAAQTPTSATLAPDYNNSKNWDDTHNVFIEGDNLEVLKILQKHYHGKIKMIYIDPPYNTGKDFVYPDNFKDGVDHYLQWSKQVNEDGKPLSTNTETGGRIHTNWLNMMYPRLKLARNLLTEDGVILISINDKEQPRLRTLCDEVFGNDNFVEQFVWVNEGNVDQQSKIKGIHEYVIAYSRRSGKWARPAVIDPNIDEKSKLFRRLIENSITKNGPANPASVVQLPVGFPASFVSGVIEPRREKYPHVLDPIEVQDSRLVRAARVESGWSSRALLDRFIDNDCKPIHDGEGRKTWFELRQTGAIYMLKERSENQGHVVSLLRNMGTTKQTSALLSSWGLDFTYPKPVDLLKYLTSVFTSSKDSYPVVLDFFSGSGTTAHAVMQLNAEDGGNRRHIQVQLPEPTPEGSEARKAGYDTIADIARERIRRAGEKIEADHAEALAQREHPLDTGFRAYKLVDTNFKQWDIQPGATAAEVQQGMLDLRDSARDDATTDELLTELLLKQGMSLTEHVTDTEIAGLDCKTITDADGDIVLLAYVNEHTPPTIDQLREMVDTKPARLVILEDCFQGNDELKTNLKQMCATHNIELKTA